MKLRGYEEAIQEAAEGGLPIGLLTSFVQDGELGPAIIETGRWNILPAVFFASTVLTTIGKSARINFFNFFNYTAPRILRSKPSAE